MPTDGTDRAATFLLRSGVALYGGFDGTEASLDARDWVAHSTTLSGDIGVPGNDTDNVYHVVTGSGTDATAVLDGFSVTAARADGNLPRNRGGGMRTIGGSPTVRHVVFHDNYAGDSNFAAFGAGMFNDRGSSPTLVDVRFERNVSESVAGGMANRNDSSPTLRDVVFLENEAGQLAGGMANESGSSPVLVNVRFERNHSAGWTGGMDNYDDTSPRLYNVQFFGNTAANYGGGMTNDTNGEPLLVNALFVGNTAANGGAVNAVGAGGLQNNGTATTLVGVTFVANEAPSGADGLGNRDKDGNPGTVIMRDAIFWQNGDELVNEEDARLDVSHALVEGGYADGTAVLDADPRFARMPSPGADATWGTADDDYGDLHLRTDSPALDSGDAAHLPADLADLDGDGDTAEAVPVDLDGNARVLGTALDLGPYEGGVTVSNEPSGTPGGVTFGSVYPNPARDSVSLHFTLAVAGHVCLTVYDALGRRVARLVDTPLGAGTHALTWHPPALAAGVYWVSLEAGTTRRVQTLSLLPL